jgi:hypothetical protein
MKKMDLSKVSKKSKMIAAVAFVLGATTLGAGVTHAEVTKSPNDPTSLLISTISQKFNLNSSEVESVVREIMDQKHKEMKAQRGQKFINQITQAVQNNKLTQAQADLITAKQTEIKAFIEGLKDMGKTARRAAIKTQMESLKQWATDNNIPKKYLMFGENHKGKTGFGHKMN